MKKLLAMLMALAMMLSFASATADAVRYEGEGYDSPEAAVEAYIEAFNEGDVRAMLSTFAIETYADHVDQRAYSERIKSFNFAGTGCFPAFNTYSRGLLAVRRMGELANILAYQFLTYSWPSAYGEFDAAPLSFKSDDVGAEISQFYEAFEQSGFSDCVGSVEFVGYMTPEQLRLDEIYNREANQKNIEGNRVCYGCDELVDRAARLRIAGEEYLQFMQCARFGNRWYNFTPVSNLAMLANLSTFQGGLVSLKGLNE